MNFNFTFDLEFKDSYNQFLVKVFGYKPERRPVPYDRFDPGDAAEFNHYKIQEIIKKGDKIFFLEIPKELEEEIINEIIDRIFIEGKKFIY